MNYKLFMMSVFLISVSILAPAFADVGCSWLVYEVVDDSTGEKSEAVLFFQNCTHMDVIGLIDESKTYVKLETPIPQKIIIEGDKFEYGFSTDEVSYPFKLSI